MDNLTDTIYLIERIESFPNENENKLYNIDYNKIVSLIKNNNLLITFDKVNKLSYLSKFSNNFTFVLKNDDVIKYFKKINFRNELHLLDKQTIIKRDAFEYYLINYVDDDYIFFIIVISINTKLVPKYFYENIMKIWKEDNLKENSNFVQFILTLMKYHFEDTNNIRNGLCENIKISKDICDKTKNYHKK